MLLRPTGGIAIILTLAALLAFPESVTAAGTGARVGIARLQYGGGGDWYCDPGSLSNWLELFEARTGVPTAPAPAVVTLDSEDLFRHPFLYLSGHGRIAMDDQEIAELRRYLDAGGFLYADDNYGLDKSFRELMARLFPDDPLLPIGSGHPIYHCFYDRDRLPDVIAGIGTPTTANRPRVSASIGTGAWWSSIRIPATSATGWRIPMSTAIRRPRAKPRRGWRSTS